MSHNDFTCTELNQLFHFGLKVQQCFGLDSEDLALIEKIEKMIDNYNETHAVLSTIDTDTLLAELAYRTESPRKYNILEGKFNSFEDYNGDKWAVKLENRSLKEI